MKKILCLTLVFSFLFSFFASAAVKENDFIKAFNEEFTYSDIKLKASFETLYNPEALALFDGAEVSGKYDISFNYDISLYNKDDIIKAASKYYISSKSNPEKDTLTTKQYFDIDFSGNNSTFDTLIKFSDSDPYLYFRLSDVPYVRPQIAALKEYIKSDSYSEFSDIKKGVIRSNKYIISLTDKEFKEFFLKISPSLSTLGAVNANDPGLASGDIFTFEAIMEKANNVKLFDSVTIESLLDSDKHLDKVELNLNINTNIYDLISAADSSYIPAYAKRNDFNFKGLIKISLDFDNLNAEKFIIFPEINSYNTYNYTNDMIQEYYYNTLEADKINVYFNSEKIYFEDTNPVAEDNRTLVPLRKFLNSLGIKDEFIVYKDGYITVNYNNEKTIVLNIFDTKVSITENGETKEENLDVSAKIDNNRVLVPLRFLSETFDLDVYYQPVDETTSFINIVER